MVRPVKRALLRIFFCFEVILFLWTYFFGAHGIHVLKAAEYENQQLLAQIVALKADIGQLEYAIAQWEKYPFFKEKHAREQLQMAREHDEIYYIT